MRQKTSSKQRKVLATKVGKAFKNEMKVLSEESKNILADDLVTAFLSRLEVLRQVSESEREVSLMADFSDDKLINCNHSC